MKKSKKKPKVGPGRPVDATAMVHDEKSINVRMPREAHTELVDACADADITVSSAVRAIPRFLSIQDARVRELIAELRAEPGRGGGS